MARTTQQIFDSMRDEAIRLATEASRTDVVNMFNNTSKVAIWRLLFYTMAFAVMGFEKLMDSFMLAVDTKIASLRPGKLSWYREKAKAFQMGFNLITDTDLFDNTGKTDAEIAASKIIAYAAATEATIDNVRVVLIKIAKLSNNNLVPLTLLELAAFTAYMNDIKFAGVRLVIYNKASDLLRATVQVYYNPLLLTETGQRTDGGGEPVKEAAIAYPLSLEFDGEFVNAGFIDALQNAYGVSRRKVNLISMERKIEGGAWQSVGSSFIPEAGYCIFETNDLTINYIPDNV